MKKLICVLLLMCFALPAGAQELAFIEVPEGAFLPAPEEISVVYPTHVLLGEPDFSQEDMLQKLLEDGYSLLEQDAFSGDMVYRSTGGEAPWEYRQVRTNEETQELRYYNPWITGERGGEHEAPPLNMLPAQSMEYCRELLKEIVPPEWLTNPDELTLLRDRWDYTDRWMTDEEYAAFAGQQKRHYFTFHQTSGAGLPILGSFVTAVAGAEGLDSLTVSRRRMTESEESISPMPLDQALTLANSTRSAPCYLVAARLVYSNWLTGSDQHNLCWQLMTDKGTYIVDCVLQKHLCDSYEY